MELLTLPFYPSLIFGNKVGAYPSESLTELRTLPFYPSLIFANKVGAYLSGVLCEAAHFAHLPWSNIFKQGWSLPKWNP